VQYGKCAWYSPSRIDAVAADAACSPVADAAGPPITVAADPLVAVAPVPAVAVALHLPVTTAAVPVVAVATGPPVASPIAAGGNTQLSDEDHDSIESDQRAIQFCKRIQGYFI
jgi:hypothetical protein